MMNQYKCVLNLIVVFALVVLSLAWPVEAQSRRAKRKAQQEKDSSRTHPVAVINNPTPQYLSGEVSVTVRGNENPIIRLGLAQNGVALIEFPANDRFFAINPGNPDLVTIEDSPTKETDRFFVMRPGTGFVPPSDGAKSQTPASSVVVQMNSGMVVTFLLYPVRDIERNAHRCVVMYDRDAIVNARRSAGLATNLSRSEERNVVRQPVTSIRIPPPPDLSPQSQNQSANPQSVVSGKSSESGQSSTAAVPANPNPAIEKTSSQNSSIESSFPTGKEKWSKTQHGLKIAVQSRPLDAKQWQVAVSVRNTLSTPVKIVPGHPELQIQTLDEKGRVLQFEPVKRLKVASTIPDGMIPPGQIARYLITYEAPVLGARQRLGVAVAQINAADEPAITELTSSAR